MKVEQIPKVVEVTRKTKETRTLLSFCKEGAACTILGFEPSVGKRFIQKLTAMGLVPGIEAFVVRNNFPGPLIVEVKSTRIVLGHGMANRILVCLKR